jgi:hypothetical protein
MLGWRTLLGLAVLDAAFFFLSGLTARSHDHSGTVSNVLWVDFLLGVLLVIALAIALAVRGAFRVAAKQHRRAS